MGERGDAVRIDIHTHAFNARDLPVRGYVQWVAGKPHWVARVAAAWAYWGTPGYRRDLERLRDAGESVPRDAACDETPQGQDKQDTQDMIAVLEGNPKLRAEVEEGLGKHGLTPHSLAGLALDAMGGVRSLLRVLKRSRLDIVCELLSTYKKVDLFAAAMIDFDKWLGDRARVTIKEQMELAHLLMLRHKGRIHFLAPFDPRRAAEAPEFGYLDLVKDAVRTKGFIGVKLYPPMGFCPSGNRLATDPDLGQTLWTAIDAQLDALYAWAEAEGVPIMAHTDKTNEAGPNYGERAHPRKWKRVLDTHRRLRLNMAHFGFTKDWVAAIAERVETADFLYGDLGHHEEMLQDPHGYFRSLLERAGADSKLTRRIMYGSDWMMLATAKGHEAYYDMFVEHFPPEGGLGSLDDLMGLNATRLLGLGAGEPNRERLLEFYKAAKIEPEDVRWLSASPG